MPNGCTRSETTKVIRQDAIDELRRFVAPGMRPSTLAPTRRYALPIALAAAGGCVLALEPNPYVFPVLEKNLN
jgi:hypothetical protein